MSNLRENYFVNGRYGSSFVPRYQLPDYDDLGRLSKTSKMLNINNCDKSSLKNCRIDRKSSALQTLDKPLSRKNADCLLSKSAHNLTTHHPTSGQDNCLNTHLNDLNPPQNVFAINNLTSRLYQMEQQIQNQSSKLFNFERKIDELNHENGELTQTLLANRTRGCNETRRNHSTINFKEELVTLKDRLNSQVILNTKLEKENIKLIDKLQSSQTKLAESEEKYEHLMQIKNRELDEHKLKIENLNMELTRKEDEANQLELDKQHLRNKVSMLNQVTDKQDEKIEQHNGQLNRFEQEMENFKKQLNCKEVDNEKLRKELILVKNSLKKVQSLNQTNENLILWLNKQLTDQQSKYSTLYPKPVKKSTSINLNQRPVDYECNLSEALSDSHLLHNRCNVDDFRTDYRTDYRNECGNEFRPAFGRSSYANELNDLKADYKTEFKNDYKICKQLNNGNCCSTIRNLSNLDRRLESSQDYRTRELKSNFISNTHEPPILYTNKRLTDDVESFKCTIGK